MPTEQEKAELAKRRGAVAAGIKDSEKRRQFIARQGEEETKGKTDTSGLTRETEKEEAYQAAGAPSMKKGGEIKKTGVYKLHKGEEVMPASRVKKHLGGKKISHKKRKGAKGKSIRISKATSGGYLAEPSYEAEPGVIGEPEQHLHPDIDSVIAHLKEHFSEGEGEAHEAGETPEFERGEQEGAREAA